MTAGDRRVVIVGGAALAAAIFVLRIIPWSVREVIRLRDTAADRVATAARAREVLTQTADVRDSFSAVLSGIVGLAPALVDGHTSTDAQVSLAGLLTLAANRQSLRVVRLDPLPDSAAGVFGRVRTHAELEGDVKGLTGLLRVIETGDPLLTVTSLVVSAPDVSARTEVLRLEIEVAGYYFRRGTK
jgi:hypothetical protein